MNGMAMLWGEGWRLPVLAYWQWGSAGMLAFGLAAVIPVLLHLWSRQPKSVQPWAAMQFLQAALRRTARRRRLATWLLLVLRCGLLLAWAVALAVPRWQPAERSSALVAPPPHVCLVLDRSYSMRCQVGGDSRFHQALALAKARVQAAAEGTAFTLVAMDQPPQAVIARPTLDRAAVLAEIDRLEAGQSPASLAATLALVQRIVLEAARQPESPRSQQVCLYSDMQQLPWSELRSAAVQSLLAVVQEHASVELIDLGQGEHVNRAIVQVECEPPLAAVGQPVQLVAEVRNFSRQDLLRQEVTVWIDQQPAGQELVDLPAGGSARVAFTHRFAQAGDRIVEFRLTDDALPLDDRRWLCVPVRRALRVLCVGSRPDDTRYLALALSPDPQAASGLEVVQRLATALRRDDWQGYDCVILSNVGAVTELAGLAGYVRDGGGLVVFVGDQVEAARYQEALALDPHLFPARVRGPAVHGNFRLRPRQEQHPIVAPFRGLPQSGLLTTPVWRYLPLVPLPGAVTVAEFDSGDAAIVTGDVGRGRCVLVATAAVWPTAQAGPLLDEPWTALPTWPSFPPLVHEMVRYVLAAQVQPRHVLVGQPLTGTFSSPHAAPLGDRSLRETAIAPAPLGGATAGHHSPTDADFLTPVQIDGPGRLQWSLPAAASPRQTQFTTPPVPRAGVYEVRQGAAQLRYVANVDPAESDLSRVAPALIEGLLVRPPAAPAAVAPALAPAQDLAWPVLVLVLLLLVAEPYLARWLCGRQL